MRFSTNITKFRLFSTNFRNNLYYNLIFFIKSNRVCKKGLKFDKKVLLNSKKLLTKNCNTKIIYTLKEYSR